jgi:hypothetical protein
MSFHRQQCGLWARPPPVLGTNPAVSIDYLVKTRLQSESNAC